VADKYKALYQDKCPDDTARFFGMITNIDENMGRLMTKLDDWGLAENTLLIFMSDNGTSGGVKAYSKWWDEVRPMMINEDASLDTGKPFIERFNRQKKDQGIPLWKPAPTD
jgi:arylsulfatase A-like enzyme